MGAETADALACTQCGRTDEMVKGYSPDLDIPPVPLCVLCWYGIARGQRGKEADGAARRHRKAEEA